MTLIVGKITSYFNLNRFKTLCISLYAKKTIKYIFDSVLPAYTPTSVPKVINIDNEM